MSQLINHKDFKIVLSLLFLLGACQVQQPSPTTVSTMKVNISSIGEEIPSSQLKYILRPFDSTYSGDYLLFKELQDYLILGINRLGLFQTSAIDSADFVFFFDYGVSDPEKYTFEITEGIYTRIGKINVDSRSATEFNYYPGYTTLKTAFIKESTTTSYASITRHGHINMYTHYMLLSCFERAKMNSDFNSSILWKMKVDAETSNKDTRVVLPYLIAGSYSLFGKNTGKLISRDIYLKPEFYPEIFEKRSKKIDGLEESVEITDDEIKIKNVASNENNRAIRIQSIMEVNFGDILYFKSKYGEKIYGIVVGKVEAKVILRTYPAAKQPLDVKVDYA